MEIENKNNFIHGAIAFLSTLVLVVLAFLLLVFLFTTPATKQEVNI
jgi:hypothetical protein